MRRSLAAAFALCLSVGAVCAQEPIKLDVIDETLPKSLTGASGNADAGKKVFLTRTLGNCLACHQVTSLKSEEFHGEFGPSLDGVAGRYTEAQLRLIVADPKRIFTDTVMPAFFKNDGLSRVRPEFAGKSILTAAQVEDVVAFLKTLN
ncbi:sulfur oxidation c-type cytochrome SoxX [Bradyrhizobium sp. CCBAU 53338]|uniref:sulfur oxidation c-type cytochrome SoxX n=1 Tax=Bradyrhizobium sp. CCBAU 53338 TaxID=1325111 RepID=UPI00188D0C5B|nr:sulfur oxidation c-type cytochrome SoxX [Bradyrhizobium sp. CCBAU 53338]QOZ53919.1 sulfur oxidation c-type cytochrome SoxX [Bradyrhizobium sp. CCBAU 53338]